MTALKDPILMKAPSIDQPDTEYQKLAKRLGIAIVPFPSDLLLKNALSSLSISVYDYSAVRNYLIAKRLEEHTVVWIPVMKQQASTTLRAKYGTSSSSDWSRPPRHGHISTNGLTYNKPIPWPVLLTIDSLVKKGKELGFQPTFFISDFVMREKKPQRSMQLDPFLAAGTSDSDALFVIERWDEPGFREETYSKKAVKKAVKKQ
jgi:hypothetical protein